MDTRRMCAVTGVGNKLQSDKGLAPLMLILIFAPDHNKPCPRRTQSLCQHNNSIPTKESSGLIFPRNLSRSFFFSPYDVIWFPSPSSNLLQFSIPHQLPVAWNTVTPPSCLCARLTINPVHSLLFKNSYFRMVCFLLKNLNWVTAFLLLAEVLLPIKASVLSNCGFLCGTLSSGFVETCLEATLCLYCVGFMSPLMISKTQRQPHS